MRDRHTKQQSRNFRIYHERRVETQNNKRHKQWNTNTVSYRVVQVDTHKHNTIILTTRLLERLEKAYLERICSGYMIFTHFNSIFSWTSESSYFKQLLRDFDQGLFTMSCFSVWVSNYHESKNEQVLWRFFKL